jgi:cytosine/adenosine deaminase-related metal-dependent hydrolase
MIDTHIHFPQTEMVGAYGEQLLSWLNTYTFPTEIQFKDKAYASEIAKFFVNELLKNGTTTALVFCTVHPESVDALFEAAEQHQMRLIAGKVMMDRHAPEALCDSADSAMTTLRHSLRSGMVKVVRYMPSHHALLQPLHLNNLKEQGNSKLNILMFMYIHI